LIIREFEIKKRSIGSDTATGRESVIIGSNTVVVVGGSVVCGAFSPNGISAEGTWLYEPLLGTAHEEIRTTSSIECRSAEVIDFVLIK
jgi:hypothetical protein